MSLNDQLEKARREIAEYWANFTWEDAIKLKVGQIQKAHEQMIDDFWSRSPLDPPKSLTSIFHGKTIKAHD